MTKVPAPGPHVTLSPAQVEAISRAIADPRRFAMLQQIAKEPSMACVGLNVKDCLSPATISHHVKELQTVGLLEVEREGRGLRLSFHREVWEAYLRSLATL